MFTASIVIAVILAIVGLTAVFYAAHTPRTLEVKTGIAAVGFALIVIALWIVGFWGAWAV